MNSLLKSSGVLVTPSILRLEVRGAPVTGFKNRKQLLPGDPPRLITNGALKKRMKAIEDAIVSALLCASQADNAETPMAASQLSLILSSVPADDSWTYIPSIIIETELVPKDEEGFILEIERL